MKKKYAYLLLTLAGCAVSLYGNKKVQEAVREEMAEKASFSLQEQSN